MKRRQLYKAFFTLVGLFVLAVGGVAQGKGHGGGNPHGGGGGGNPHGGGGGQQVRQAQQPRAENPNRGGGNGWGRHGGDQAQRVAQQRVYQPQQRVVQPPQQRVFQQQQRAVRQDQGQQRAMQAQRQAEWNARMQQRMSVQNVQRQQPEVLRGQQQAWRQQRQVMRSENVPQQQYQQPMWNGHDRGLHNGWNNNGPRGNAYGMRGVWPGPDQGWRDANRQFRRGDRDGDRDDRRNASVFYYANPLVTWAPPAYRTYYYSNYAPQYYYPPTRDTIVRTIISAFFAPDYGTYYDPNYYSYDAYSAPQYYAPPYDAYAYDYAPLGYSYAPAGYSYSYDSYSSYDDPAYYDPYYGTRAYNGDNLNIGLVLVQSLLGQGYEQGLYDGQYARTYYRRTVYLDPYAVPAAYYSPVVSSLADERQVFEEGYQLGYQDAMRNRDPYNTLYGSNARVDLVGQFLGNSLIGV